MECLSTSYTSCVREKKSGLHHKNFYCFQFRTLIQHETTVSGIKVTSKQDTLLEKYSISNQSKQQADNLHEKTYNGLDKCIPQKNMATNWVTKNSKLGISSYQNF